MRKMIKKFCKSIFCVVLSVAMVMVNISGEYFVNDGMDKVYASEYTVGNSTYEYEYNGDGTVTIIGYSGNETDLVIPSEIEGMQVTGIGMDAFFCCDSLITVEISEGIISIGDGAFYGCSNLVTVEIPKGVNCIGMAAFQGCSSLERIEIPKGITSINDSTFLGCSNLKMIDIPEGVTSIGDGAFYRCSNLVTVEIPEEVTSIKEEAFRECSSLERIKIPKKVTSIGDRAFFLCSSLEEIEVEDNNTYYKTENGVLFDKKMTTILNYPSGKNGSIYNIPEGVTNIGDGAFGGCSGLKAIEIPEGVKYIGNLAFCRCSSLETIKIPKGVEEINGWTFSECSNLVIVEIPKGVTGIGDYAFDGCSSLVEIEIPEGVVDIGDYAFRGCSSLRAIEIPKSVADINYCGLIDIENLIIYGYKGTAAQTYAMECGFEFIEISLIEDEQTGISIKYEEAILDSNISLNAKMIENDSEEAESIKEVFKEWGIAIEDIKYTIYDINLVDESNDKVQPKGKVTVKLPCPEVYEPDNTYVYHIADGEFKDMNAKHINGYMVFLTEHFSVYVITDYKITDDATVAYGDSNSDGKINVMDAVLMKKYIAGFENITINEGACDVNKDGRINVMDAVMVLKHIAGFDVVLGN